jgi:hypothetical protein
MESRIPEKCAKKASTINHWYDIRQISLFDKKNLDANLKPLG